MAAVVGAAGSPGGASTNLLAASLMQPAAPPARSPRTRSVVPNATTGPTTAHAHPPRGATAVKLWLLKGVVQKVRKAGDRSARRVRYESNAPAANNAVDGPSPMEMPEASHLVTNRPSAAAVNSTESQVDGTQETNVDDTSTEPPTRNAYTFTRHAIRSNYMDKSIEAKKKVIRMLFVVVAEFFVCWAPLHVLNTWYLFSPEAVYTHVGSTGISLVHLLAYVSSCCNPITYCFMNRKFRQAFLGIFDCYRYGRTCCCCCCEETGESRPTTGRRAATATATVGGNHSDISANDSTQGVGRASLAARSEVVVLEGEDRV